MCKIAGLRISVELLFSFTGVRLRFLEQVQPTDLISHIDENERDRLEIDLNMAPYSFGGELYARKECINVSGANRFFSSDGLSPSKKNPPMCQSL